MALVNQRAAKRADRSGSGPTRSDAPPARFPGATSAFGLLGEVLLVGVLVTVASLPIVTLPVALAAGVRHLGRFLRAEASPLRQFWRDLRAALVGGIGIGAIVVVLAAVLVLDVVLANTVALPGAEAIAIVGWVGLALVATALCSAAGRWSPETGWLAAVRGVPRAWRADVAGALYLVATVVFAGVVTWQLAPLIIPALGCVALAIFAVPQRPRRDRAEA
jgi:hypothetical protein